jgi:hypothetical protein
LKAVDKLLQVVPNGLDLLSPVPYSRSVELNTADIAAFADFKPGGRPVPAQAVVAAEQMVEEWTLITEEVLQEAGLERDERFQSLQGEYDFWRQRANALSNIMDQLKSHGCQNVMGLLIACQSKVLKRWRLVDTMITDAANEAKDVLKFFDSAAAHLKAITSPSYGMRECDPALQIVAYVVDCRYGCSWNRRASQCSQGQWLFTSPHQLVHVYADHLHPTDERSELNDAVLLGFGILPVTI